MYLLELTFEWTASNTGKAVNVPQTSLSFTSTALRHTKAWKVSEFAAAGGWQNTLEEKKTNKNQIMFWNMMMSFSQHCHSLSQGATKTPGRKAELDLVHNFTEPFHQQEKWNPRMSERWKSHLALSSVCWRLSEWHRQERTPQVLHEDCSVKNKKTPFWVLAAGILLWPGCRLVPYSRVYCHYWDEHQQRKTQVILVSTGKAMEGLAGWRADTHRKGEQQEPMALTLRWEAGELPSGPGHLGSSTSYVSQFSLHPPSPCPDEWAML